MSGSRENKLLQIPLTAGLDQSYSTFGAPMGTLSTCQNLRYSKLGVLAKRSGTRRVVGSVAFSSHHSVMGNGTSTYVELPAFMSEVGSAVMCGTTSGDAFCLDSTRQLGNGELWEYQGSFSTCTPVQKRYGLVGLPGVSGFGKTPPGVAVNSDGYLMCVAVDDQGLMHAYIESPSGIRIWYQRFTGSVVVKAQCFAQGTGLYLVYQIGAALSGTFVVPSSTGVTITSNNVFLNLLLSSVDNWDTSPYGSALWVLAYQNAAANVRTKIYAVDVQQATFDEVVTGSCPVSVWGDNANGKIWLGWYNNPGTTGDVKYDVYTVSGGALRGAATIMSQVLTLGPPLFGSLHTHDQVALATTAAFCCFRYVDDLSVDSVRAMNVTVAYSDATVTGSGTRIYHAIPISKPDAYQRVWCMACSGDGNAQTQQAVLLRFNDLLATTISSPVIELSSPTMEATSGAATSYSADKLPIWFHSIATGSTRSYYAIPFVLASGVLYPTVKIEVYEYQTGEQNPHSATLKLGPRTVVAGCPVEFYGLSAAQLLIAGTDTAAFPGGASEIGFASPPVITGMSQNGVVGVGPGTYSYKAVHEWIDTYGRIHRSAPSKAVSITTTDPSSTIDVRITAPSLTQRKSQNVVTPPVVKLYRTLNAGTTYHELPGSVSGDGIVVFSDVWADSSVSATLAIYTDGGVLNHNLAPSNAFFCRAEDRVWFGGLWDPTIIQCSKVLVPEEPIQCTDHVSHQVPLLGKCRGLAYMDGQIVIFLDDAIYALGGDGPNDQGIGSFSAPRLVALDIGCINPKSVVETNAGVFFQSRLGIHLLPRGFGPVQYVGGKIDTQIAATPNCLASGVVSSTRDHLVRFLMAAAGSTTSTVACTYDLNTGMWFTDTFAVDMMEMGTSRSQTATTVDAEAGFTFCRASLNSSSVTYPVWIDATTYTDDENNVQYDKGSLTTNWIFPFGVGGFGKIHRVVVAFEQTQTATSVNISVKVDSYTANSGSFTIASGTNMQYREIICVNTQGTAVQITIQDLSQGDWKVASLTIEVEPHQGARLLTAAERA